MLLPDDNACLTLPPYFLTHQRQTKREGLACSIVIFCNFAPLCVENEVMTKILTDQYDKSLLRQLPKAAFGGRIVEVLNEHDADSAVDYLLGQPILGFDTETKPSFLKGKRNKVSLLQVATHDVCYLFRLNRMGMPGCVVRLLSDKEVLKVALAWRDDVCSLRRRKTFECGTFLELQSYAAQLGIKDMSLQKLYANVMGECISKTQRLTNWDREELTMAQKLYAATDAWACVRLYEELHRLQETGDYELRIQEPAS